MIKSPIIHDSILQQHSTIVIIMSIIVIGFIIYAVYYYYNYGSPYHNKSLKKKLRVMWNNIILTLDTTQTIVPLIFNRYILKHQMCERLIHIGRAGSLWMNELPYNLLKDIFDIYKTRLNIFTSLNYVIISEHIDVLRIIYPDISLNRNETPYNLEIGRAHV